MGKIKDIEDLFEPTVEEDNAKIKVARTTKKKAVSKRKRNQLTNEEDPLVLPSEIPSMDEDYVGWLNYQKIKWKIQARDRKRRDQLFGNTNSSRERSALGSMIRKQAESYANSTWEVLQYKDSGEPGVLEVFVTINGKVQNITFHIPKTIYMKFKSQTMPLQKIKNCLIENLLHRYQIIPKRLIQQSVSYSKLLYRNLSFWKKRKTALVSSTMKMYLVYLRALSLLIKEQSWIWELR